LSLLLAVGCAVVAPRAGSAEELAMMLTVDYRDPIPPALLKKAGIDHVYVGVGLPVRKDRDTGKPSLDPKVKEPLERFLKLYGDHGIKVLLESNFYARPPKGTECVDAHGRTIRMGCFNNDAFLSWMGQAIRDMAQYFSAYEAFGGFLFDDGVQVRVDCCYCDTCRRLFREKHGIDPPPFEPGEETARLAPDDPRLLWDAFQRQAYARYQRAQAEAARSVSEKLVLATIPSDSYFFGRHLNAQLARDATAPTNSARIQRIDRLHVRHWHIFQSFPIPRVVPDGTGQEPWAIGCHLTTPSPCMIFHHGGPQIETMGRQQFLSPAEIRRLLRTTLAEGADAIGFWESARAIPHYPDAFDAIGSVGAEARGLDAVLLEREPFPSRLALLYSTASEIAQQPWRENTIERWRHLHAFEAMAYALTRRSIQFHVVLDSELDEKALAAIDVLVLTGVTHLSRPVAERVEKAITTQKLTVLTDPVSLPLDGAKACRFNPDYWLKRQQQGYRQSRYLDQQAHEIAAKVVPQLRLFSLQPVQVASESCFVKLFGGKRGSLLAFVVNWDTQAASTARLSLREPSTVRDEMSGRDLGRVSAGKALELELEPAGWRILRCTQ
jgi:hypothetical protein